MIATAAPATEPIAERLASTSPVYDGWPKFGLIAVGVAAAWACYVALIVVKVGGARGVAAIDDLGLGLFEFGAAASCYFAARQLRPLRRSFLLLSGAGSAMGIGQLIWCYYELVLRQVPPIPSVSDAGNVAALVLAISAGLALPSAPTRAATKWRLVVDAAQISLSSFFIVWVLGLSQLFQTSNQSARSQATGVGYVVAQSLVLTVFMMSMRRAKGDLRTRLVLLTTGMLINFLGFSWYAYLTGTHQFGPQYRIVDAATALGFAFMFLSARVPGQAVGEVVEEGPASTVMAAIPAAYLFLGAIAALVTKLLDRPIDPSPVVIVLASSLAGLLVASLVLTHRDSLALLAASRRAETNLRDQTTLLNQVLTHAPAGLARLDLDVRIVDANPSLCALLGASAEALVRSPVTRLLPAGEVSAAVQHLVNRVDATDTVTTESQATQAYGAKVWVRWSLTAVRRPDGEIAYYLLTVDDIDSKHKAEEAAIASLAGLERLNRLKSEFVSLVSHEFRTALTGIQGFAEMMRDQDLDAADVKQISGDIFNDAARVNRMITDMLDLDRMEAGRMTFRMGAVNLNKIAGEAVERARATTPRHRIELDPDPNLPDVAGDSDRLTQVLANLLSNAIKYSPDGGDIVVRTKVISAAIEVTVSDHGAGIPPEFVDKLFERYERLERGLTTTVGTGLGLAIARRIVEGHGGRIWVESKVGVGSDFHFTVPLQIPRPDLAEAGGQSYAM